MEKEIRGQSWFLVPFLFDLDGETMLKRLLYRASQSEVKRDDDKEEVMKKRIETFEKSIPIFNKYGQAG